MNSTPPSLEDIAIIGMSGRFPGARNLAEFWNNLRDGVESVQWFSEQELSEAGVSSSTRQNPDFVNAGGPLADIEMFDAPFFALTAREAETLDPQQRLLLECAWQALEDAAYDPQAYPGSIGVYAGGILSSYLFHLLSNPEHRKFVGDFQVFTGNDKDHLTTRISYKLNLKGPSVTVQTACSTSLVAVAMACQSLLNYQCDMVLAGGVAIRVPQKMGYVYQEGMIFSRDGHCRPFDAEASGTLFSNGVGMVVLKRLADAVADRDCIHAVIKAAAINNDGSLKVGYTAPSMDAQAEVIAMAHGMAGVSPETITYIEAHGTATPLGDPIEIAALTKAFRAGTGRKEFCAIGSVKSNLGHLDAAAGIAGLIKTVLALKHQQIPPSINFNRPNPVINFAESPFYVNPHLSKWPDDGGPRRAGVSSFGMGGTNAHVVLEEAPSLERTASTRSQHLLLLSARSKSALDRLTAGYAKYLQEHATLAMEDVAYTTQVGRRAFTHRRILVSPNTGDAASALARPDAERVFSAAKTPGEHPIAFLFPGQGAQHINMGREIYLSEPTFRQCVDNCCEILKPFLGFDLRSILYPEEVMSEDVASRLGETEVAQPALFVIEYALSKLWMEWGVHPETMLGHSIGEYVAACLADVFSLEDALRIVAERGRLMQGAPRGAMLAVPLSERDTQPFLGPDLQIAAINLPSSCVVSGPVEAVERFTCSVARSGIECTRLRTSHAFHSPMMDSVLQPFAEAVARTNPREPKIPFVSNVTGTWITSRMATDPAYWARHLREPVLFSRGLECLLNGGNRTLLEVGPGQSLTALAKRHPAQIQDRLTISSMARVGQQTSDPDVLLTSLGRLWLMGCDVEWSRFNSGERRKRVSLPTYPFERKRHWVESQSVQMIGHGASEPRGKLNFEDWFRVPCWKQTIVPDAGPTNPARDKACWLVLEDNCGVGATMGDRLESAKKTVVRVRCGEAFTQIRENLFIVNPRRKEHYNHLFKELRKQNKFPQHIAHLWSVSHCESALEDHLVLGFYSLLFLAQALGEDELEEPIRLGVISNALHNVIGNEATTPAKATLLGPCKVIPQEYRNISCRSIDIGIAEAERQPLESLIDLLVADIESSSAETTVAYRGNRRWTQTFEPTTLPEYERSRVRLREHGVYLITGGLGGIGLSIATYLAETVKAKLVLLSRSAVPGQDEWAGISDHGPSNKFRGMIRQLKAIQEMGAEILILNCDVSDSLQMEQAVAETLDRFGALHGVIHSAGVAGGGIIQLKTSEMAAAVLAPKVHGTLALDAALKDIPLDFLVLCSSLSSVLGGVGQVDYSAANSFLDAYAERRRCDKKDFVISINWDAWRDVGMAALASCVQGRQRRPFNLSTSIPPEQGVRAFARILSLRSSQVSVSAIDFTQTAQHDEPAPNKSRLAESNESESSHSEPRSYEVSLQAISDDDVERRIAEIWQKLLGARKLSIYDNFFELGGDSLLGTQLLSLLRSVFRVQLPLQSLLEVPTVAGMAARIKALQ